MSMRTFRNKNELLPSTAEWYASGSLAEPQSVDTCTRSALEEPI